MSKVFLLFSAALVALMAGALFYAARFPVAQQAVATAATEQTTVAAAQLVADSYPSFSLPDLAGIPHQLAEWDGSHRILNFWATWCAPCRREIPILKAFQEKHGSDRFQVIGIAVDFAEDVERYSKEAEFNYPILVGQEDAMAVAESSGIQFMALPFTMFIAADGEYLNAFMGELHAPQLERVATIMSRLDRREMSREAAKDALGSL